MKKLLAEIVCAAFVLTGPGQGFSYAIEKAAPRAVVPGLTGAQARPGLPAALVTAVPVITAADHPKAQAPVSTMGRVIDVSDRISAPGVAAGGVEAAQAIDSLYLNSTKPSDGSIVGQAFILPDGSPAHFSILSRPASRQDRALSAVEARSARPGSSSMLVTVAVVAGVGAVGYFFRHQVMAIVNPILDRVIPAKMRYAYLVNNLEKAHTIYNNEVMALQTRYNTSESELIAKIKEAADLQPKYIAKAQEAKGAAEGSPARDAAYADAVTLKKQYDTAMEVVGTMQKRFNGNKAALKQLLERRENFFHLQATSLATVKERLDAKDNGDLEAREAAITKKYEIGASEQLDKANAKVNEAIAHGKAAMDELNSSAAGQVKNAGDAARDTKAKDAIDAILNGTDKKAGTSAMLDPQAGKYLRPALWAIGAVAIPMIVVAGHGIAVLVVASLLGLAPLIAAPSHFMQQRSADLFVVGAGSIGAGWLIAAAGGAVGWNVAVVGSMMFLGPAALLAGLGLFGAYKNFMAMRGQTADAPMTPIAAPSRFNPMAVIREKLAAAGKAVSKTVEAGADAVAKATEKAAPAAQPVAEQPAPAQPAGPTIGESAQRAGEAAGKIVGAGKEAAGKIAGQAGEAARQGADKLAQTLESAADQLAKATGDMSAGAGQAPSAAQIAERLKNVGSRLASVATTVAEKGVGKLEDIANQDPNAPKSTTPPGLISRTISALKAILAMEIQKVQSTPEYRAYVMRAAAAKADEESRGMVLRSAEKYYIAKLTAQDAQDAIAKIEGQLKDLNLAKHPENERHAVPLIGQKNQKQLEVISQLRDMGKAKKIMADAMAQRAALMTDAAERLAAVKDGLSEADIADMQSRLAMIAQDYYQTMKESQDVFKAEVIKRIAKNKAQEDLANADPNKLLAEAQQAASNTKIEDELAALKQAPAQN